jgi:TM2 domain-containing membrane protein YozV
MYCPRCGTQIADGSTFCSSCGANLVQPPPPVYASPAPYGAQQPYGGIAYRRKSEGIALLLAILLPGAGHLYGGKIVKGIVIMLTFFAVPIVIYLAWLLFFTPADFTVDWPFGSIPNTNLIVFTVIMAIVLFILWIYQLIDAYNVTKRFNSELMATGREPW